MAKTPTGGEAAANAGAQNPDTQKATAAPDAPKTPEQLAEETNEPQFFEGTVVKIDADGNEVMSDHLLPGETLRRAVSDLHYANPAQAKANDEEARENAKRDAEAKRKAAENR